jgi:DNA end-binding protein Ku
MPARSISTASLTFGLVSIPVRLFPATSSKSVSFHLLHAKDMSRIQQKIYCPKEDKIVDRSELVRGYEVEKDRYVTFTDEELKKLEAQADRAVEITEFIPASEVDPVYFENSYLLGCEPTSAKAYHLLEEAMTKADKVGVAKFTMRGKERVVLIRPYEGGLMLHTMYYAEEVRKVEGFGAPDVQLKEAEVKVAHQLIEALADEWNPEKYQDSFQENLKKLIEAKLEGGEVAAVEKPKKLAPVVDLMAALKQSLAQMEGKKKPAAAAKSEEPRVAASGKSRRGR